MHRVIMFFAAAAVLLVGLACGFTVNLPVDNIVTGPTQTQEISIDYPGDQAVDLNLNFGAGDLKIGNGHGEKLIQGTAKFNVADFAPSIETVENQVNLSTGDLEINGIPKLSSKVENNWDLQIGSQPINLQIMAGAYRGEFEFGGMALQSLDITDGAADVRLLFSSPNLVEMERMRYQTGASEVSLNGLANANFKSMIFRGGAGDYRLDFSGTLQRDGVVTVETGFSQLTIAVPANISATVITNGGLMEVNSDNGWLKQGDNYLMENDGPSLTITVEMGAGSLQLKTIH